ncbi:uncharacterized protein [Solanum lycopersicum]|uniref:uncharacterized protein n=1 Tax=Solanum lycopersicum TaxID=4081 RepID=UPI00374A81C1
MAPFEALYGRRCRSPIGWFDSAEIDPLDSDLLRDAMEEVFHPVFHVSMLRMYILDESHVIPLDSVEFGPDLTFEEEPIAILYRQVRKLRTKEVASVKVHWKHRTVGEATWETESDMRARYPQLFEASGYEPRSS